MTIDDRPNFAEAFRRLVQTFRVRLKAGELEELTTTYFKLLQGWTLEEVLAAGKTCITTLKKFPAPVDWLSAMPTKANVAADVRWMGADEAREYSRAEALGYEDAACDCLLCQAAGTDRPVRFVPDFTADDREERAFHPAKNQIVTVGHWAHGEELVRCYAARAQFYGLLGRSALRRMARPLELVGGREPGQEG